MLIQTGTTFKWGIRLSDENHFLACERDKSNYCYKNKCLKTFKDKAALEFFSAAFVFYMHSQINVPDRPKRG